MDYATTVEVLRLNAISRRARDARERTINPHRARRAARLEIAAEKKLDEIVTREVTPYRDHD